MNPRVFELSLGGDVHPNVAEADLRAILADVASEAVEFAILSEERCGWFVQAAGAHGLVTVEFQHRKADGRRQHVRLCRSGLGAAGEVRRQPRVSGFEGYLEKELLSVEDAARIFERFATALDVPAYFDRVDITDELGLE